jgi:hypothetical protein
MATNYNDSVNAFYLAYYGRPADPGGLAFWTQALQKNNGDFSAIVDAFSTSAEATARFGGDSVSDRVIEIYQQLFNRAPEKDGLEFWTKAIESGRLSMANAAIEIMHGAQNADEQISTLRLDAAAQFTAQVAASGVAYDGDAAVQAARVVISAVTAGSKAADIDSLVKAGASLVQTAHDNPAVIQALANGGDLGAVLNTASGKADPVSVVQALASIGKAALSDSSGLSTLLKGGGMAGLLDSLPAGTSAKDVAAAVSQGGLWAGSVVANPPVDAPSAPAPAPAAPKIALAVDSGASATDHITNKGSFNISGLGTGSTWEYSIDKGGKWLAGTPVTDGSATLTTTVPGAHTLQVRAVDAAGKVSATASFDYTLKNYLDGLLYVYGSFSPEVTLNSSHLSFNYMIAGEGPDVTKIYQVSSTGKADDFHDWNPSQSLADGTYYFRLTGGDIAGNTYISKPVTVHLDNTAPAAPSLQLAHDSGVAGDGITNDGRFIVSGLQPSDSWTFSFDGKTWYAGSAIAADGTSGFTAWAEGEQTLLVKASDKAGNYSDIASLHFTLDTTPAAPGLIFDHVGDGAPFDRTTTLPKADVVFSFIGTLDSGAFAEYSFDGITWLEGDGLTTDAAAGTITIHDVDLSGAAPSIQVRVTDLAGNVNLTESGKIQSSYTQYFAKAADGGIFLNSKQDGHIYLTDSGQASVRILSSDSSGDAVANKSMTIGVQETGVSGVIGVGPSADSHIDDHAVYGLGSNGSDTLHGHYAWGYDGDDDITALGNEATVVGGAGADAIHVTAAAPKLVIHGASESSIVADGTAAHGFDTVYVNLTNLSMPRTTLSFMFDTTIQDAYDAVTASSYTGAETGTELLALLNGAAAGSFRASGHAEATVVKTGSEVSFLVVDTNGDATIDAADYVVKIVGSIDGSVTPMGPYVYLTAPVHFG